MHCDNKFQITFDEGSGELKATHRCTVELNGLSVGHSREIELSPEVETAMRAFIDQSRSEVEEEAKALAVSHSAAVTGKVIVGVKRIKVGGSLTGVGDGPSSN